MTKEVPEGRNLLQRTNASTHQHPPSRDAGRGRPWNSGAVRRQGAAHPLCSDQRKGGLEGLRRDGGFFRAFFVQQALPHVWHCIQQARHQHWPVFTPAQCQPSQSSRQDEGTSFWADPRTYGLFSALHQLHRVPPLQNEAGIPSKDPVDAFLQEAKRVTGLAVKPETVEELRSLEKFLRVLGVSLPPYKSESFFFPQYEDDRECKPPTCPPFSNGCVHLSDNLGFLVPMHLSRPNASGSQRDEGILQSSLRRERVPW